MDTKYQDIIDIIEQQPRSAYFLQNTSKLGALDTTLRPEQRPDLGMGCLRSPDSKKSSSKSGSLASKKSSTFRAGDSKNETYTVSSSAETTFQEEAEGKKELGARDEFIICQDSPDLNVGLGQTHISSNHYTTR